MTAASVQAENKTRENKTRENKTRANNIELLRIIAMLMIVSHHFVFHGEALRQTAVFSVNWFFSWTVEAVSVAAVNCYVLISGYFLVTSRFKVKKLIRLWLEVLFYSAGIYLLLTGLGLEHFSIRHLAGAFLPVLTNQYWFATVYIAMYIFSPFLNISINALSKRQFLNLLIILFAMLSIWPTVLPFGYSLDRTNGYSIIQFVFLYFIGAYLRLHWNYELKKGYYIGAYILISIIVLASKVMFTYLGLEEGISYLLFEYNSVTIVLSSVMLFLFFRSISLKNALLNKLIGSVSVLTFGVYLIHDNVHVQGMLYKKVFHTGLFMNTPLFIPLAVGSVVGIFTACICIDAVRKKIFEAFEGSRFSNIIQEKISLSLNNRNL
ncbi:MAG TPA: acyltransferase [Ignavibacteriales bacterium]|nr:acyltransferase [Ignavibacteriales bacterium]